MRDCLAVETLPRGQSRTEEINGVAHRLSPLVALGPPEESPTPVREKLPEWALEKWGSEQGVYEYFSRYDDPDDLEAAWYSEAEQAASVATTEEATEGMLGDYTGITEGYRKFLSGVQQDPYRLAALEELRRYASPEYSAVTPQQRTAMELVIAWELSRAWNRMQSNLGAAGWGESGAAIGLDPLFTSIGAGALTNLSGQIAMENEQVRRQAAQALSSNALFWQNLEAGIYGDIAKIEREEALLRGDPVLTESDAWQAPLMNWVRQQGAEEREFLDEALANLDEQAEFDLMDLANVGINLLWGGGFGG